MSPPPASPPNGINALAAQWLAKRDRGMSAAERAAFQEWRLADSRHEAAVSRIEKTWGLLDQLVERRPAADSPPNPDLLAPRRLPSRWIWLAPLAAAAMALVYFASSSHPGRKLADVDLVGPNSAKPVIFHPGPRRQVLEDGSIVELNAAARIDVQFTAAERQVRLVSGEAFFTVQKNPQRPFIVSADRIAVRAVGTAFSVTFDREEVCVLVTEGKVGVGEVSRTTTNDPSTLRPLSALVAGQQGVVHLSAPGSAALEMKVTDLAPLDVEQALAWQGPRLEFANLSLAEVVTEFNRYNARKLIVGDTDAAAIKLGGTFRADNVDAFVRLLESSFGVTAVPQENRVILRKTHGP